MEILKTKEQGLRFNPPAIGVDFFQGPYSDKNDGIDNDRMVLLMK